MQQDDNDVVYNDTDIDAAAEAESFQDLPRPRYVSPITGSIRSASIALILVAVLLVFSGTLTWFKTTTLKEKATIASDGFYFGWASSWIASISIGWILVAVAIVLVAASVKILRAHEAVWLRRVSVGCAALSAATAVFVLVDTSHFRSSVPAAMRKQSEALLALADTPDRKAAMLKLINQQLEALAVHNGIGSTVALVAALACAVIAAIIALQSKRPSESSAS
ncbi:MAG: hypothetical protein WCK14_12690 [Actinomycetota bacterium]|jgi:hypothetical protein